MDRDGDLDLAIGSVGVNQLFRNDGLGFTELTNALSSATNATRSIAWGDMDGDGDLDLAVANNSQAKQLFRNDGGAVFTELVGALGNSAGYFSESVTWGDMNGDGDLDLAFGQRLWGQPVIQQQWCW